jgi:hypothetical protein
VRLLLPRRPVLLSRHERVLQLRRRLRRAWHGGGRRARLPVRCRVPDAESRRRDLAVDDRRCLWRRRAVRGRVNFSGLVCRRRRHYGISVVSQVARRGRFCRSARRHAAARDSAAASAAAAPAASPTCGLWLPSAHAVCPAHSPPALGVRLPLPYYGAGVVWQPQSLAQQPAQEAWQPQPQPQYWPRQQPPASAASPYPDLPPFSVFPLTGTGDLPQAPPAASAAGAASPLDPSPPQIAARGVILVQPRPAAAGDASAAPGDGDEDPSSAATPTVRALKPVHAPQAASASGGTGNSALDDGNDRDPS